MNGDFKTIYDAVKEVEKKIVEIQTTQRVRHSENKRYMLKLDDLPCSTQTERIRSLQVKVGWLFTLVVSVLILGVLSQVIK